MSVPKQSIYEFGEYRIETGERQLRRGDRIVSLPPKAVELLFVLLESGGRVLNKEELMKQVWADAFVEEGNLSHNVFLLRKAFGEGETFIETLPRRGYRFAASVRQTSAADGSAVLIAREQTLTRIVVEEEIEVPDNSLIGRDREIAVVKNLLRRKDTKILTLTGVGGAGKTSLARVVLSELADDFADGGAAFVDLSAVSDSETVASAVTQTLGVKESGEKDLFDSLKNYLQAKEMLLVLDNFEQVINAAGQISALVTTAPKLKILVTSRARLHLNVEREFAVPPLALPSKEKLPEEVIECAAVRLFVERARRVKPNFALTDENAFSIAEICRRLDGLPLAIELAAARVRLMPPQSILERLENQLKFLTGGARELPFRQQTMRAAIAWSYELLDENEKRFFEFAAIFAGGFSLDAAESIFPFCYPQSKVEVLDLIDSLVDQNLLTANEQPGGGGGGEIRFRYLESIREFAREKLNAGGERRREIERNHAEYFLRRAEEIEPQLRGKKANESYAEFKTEHDNLRAALDYFREHYAEKNLRLAAAMSHFWATFAYFSEGRARIEAALQKACDKPSRLRGVANKGAAIIAWKQGDYEAAKNFNFEILRNAEILGDEHLQAVAFNGLGTIAYLRGENTDAQNYFKRGLDASRKFGDDALTLSIIVGLSEVKRLERDWQAARALTEESLCYINAGDLKRPFIGAHINLGALAFMEGNFAAAENHFQTARNHTPEDNLHAVSLCIDGFAALAAQKGEIERALELTTEAQKIRDEIGYKLELPDRIFREEYLASLKDKTDAATFASLIKEGRALTTSEAIDSASNDF